ncbi:MAG: heme exporter protein CcmB, partial [Bacteroidetes bacterium]|nr:heme exporter protein CcmB [Bacteroidota bacterium]
MQTFLKNAWTIFQKDIRLEKRTRESFSAMFVFAVLVLVTFNFTMTPDKEQILQLGPGILWVAFTFAGTLGLNRAFAAESENGNFQALMMLPIDKSSIYLGKLFSGLLFMLLMEVFVIPLFVV